MKRFTETNKWDDPWFRKLPPRLKCLWQYLCDRCDHSGTIEPDFELASFQIGETVTEDDVRGFGDRVEILPSGKWWVVQFVPFQFGALSIDCKAHGPVFAALMSNGLKDRVSKGYPKGFHTPKEKEKDKDKEKDQGVQGEKLTGAEARSIAFATFWHAYPKKKSKGAAEKAWAKVGVDISVILRAIDQQRLSHDWTKNGGQYIPNPATWLNARGWEDEPTTIGASDELAGFTMVDPLAHR